MLHQSTSGFTPRPRPPRSRSHQQTLNSAPPVTLHGANKDISEMVRQSILESRDVGIVALDTPQYTPPLGQLEQPALSSSTSQKIGKEVMLPSGDSNTSLPRSSSQRSIRSPEELEELLYQAHRIIQDRERGEFAVEPKRHVRLILIPHIICRPDTGSLHWQVLAR